MKSLVIFNTVGRGDLEGTKAAGPRRRGVNLPFVGRGDLGSCWVLVNLVEET
jgi:hypothetical protein